MIVLKEVVKEFRGGWLRRRGPIRALDGVSLTVESGSAVGIVGLNGAGKSTLIRILLGYTRPTSGSVTIDGREPRHYVESHGIAYVPERATLPGGWKVRHALATCAMLGEVPGDTEDAVDRAIARLGLTPLAERPVGELSKGNVQRVAIAQALLADRKVMVLDEPGDGLDPVWIAELRAIVEEWRAADPTRTVIIASHTLPEVERIADTILLLHRGRIEADLSRRNGRTLEESFLARIAELPAVHA
jgi:ABC-2 type transport system ATP-binding protein